MSLEKNRKTADLLTMCFKAGKAVKGFDPAVEAMKKGTVCCVLTASDASARTVKEIEFYCGRYNAFHLPSGLSKADMERLSGKASAVVAVCDKGFAEGFAKLLR